MAIAFLSRPRKPVLPVCAFLISLFLIGCQTLPPPQSAQLNSQQALTVPFVAQQKYQCGPAALAMMLKWAGKDVSANSLVDEVWLPERQGSLGIELQAAARSRGLLAYPVGTADALFRELQAGRPVLVMQNLALPAWPQWHFAVVTGYQEQGRTMVLHSGTTQNKTTHWNRFIRTWARAGQWGFTLVSPGELPASASPDTLFRAISDTPNNSDFWPAAVEAFPYNAHLWFGYGNSLWRNGDTQGARQAFETSVKLAPTFAAAWNNLAYAWHKAGNPQKSRHSLCTARQLAPDDQQIKDSGAELGYACP